MKNIVAFFTFIIVLFFIDLIWLVGAKKFHENMVMKVQHSKLVVNKLAGLLFYVLAASMFLLIIHKIAQKSSKDAAIYGAIMGAGIYFTFDLTNKAIFQQYEWKYAIADGLWGTFAVALASFITTKLVYVH